MPRSRSYRARDMSCRWSVRRTRRARSPHSSRRSPAEAPFPSAGWWDRLQYMSAAQKSDQIEPFRQGFVGYVNVDGRQWRVLVRLRLEDEAWWRGRLWFCGGGGPEGWGKGGLLGRGPEEVVGQAGCPPAPGAGRRRPGRVGRG